MLPTKYEEQLKGALFMVDCTLHHFVINQRKDTFTTDLICLRVLAPPEDEPIGQKDKKRKNMIIAPDGPLSPKKKGKMPLK